VPNIDVVARGTIDDRGSAFPQATELDDGTMVCAYSNSGGQFSTGGTDWARFDDDAQAWTVEGTVLAHTPDPPSSNFLKLSRSIDGAVLYAYGARSRQLDPTRFGERTSEAIFCTSTDGASSWSLPSTIPMPTSALEISHGILAHPSGRLLAPAATIEPGRLGEHVIIAISDDGGYTWPCTATAMSDPAGAFGYLEQKLTLLGDGRVMATAWTVTLDRLVDQPNSYALSDDAGETWSAPRSMGIFGQTLSAVHLDGNRFLLLYNRRYGAQGIVAALARLQPNGKDARDWTVDAETLIHDPQLRRDGRQRGDGVSEMLDFEFGFPTATARLDGTIMATYWSVEDGSCGVRWATLKLDV
jgi:sialidase-1